MGIFVVELFISYITCLQLPFNYCFDLFLEPELKARKQMRLPLSPSPPSAVCKCKLPVRDAQAGYTALTPEELGLQRGPGTALTPAPRSGARCRARRRLPGVTLQESGAQRNCHPLILGVSRSSQETFPWPASQNCSPLISVLPLGSSLERRPRREWRKPGPGHGAAPCSSILSSLLFLLLGARARPGRPEWPREGKG